MSASLLAVILASGCFDGLHAGHVRYLRAASAISPRERLYVAIAPDAYIRRLKQRDAYWSQAERAETVFALHMVDRVLLQEDDTPAALIRQYAPQWFVKGRDWRDQLPADIVAACQDVGCEVRYVNTPGRHTRVARG